MFYDLHMHSCLSPCAEDEMTPNNICGMALVKGLELIAVTDHNSVKQLPAVAKVASEMGLRVLFGCELETSEEVHVLGLFSKLEDAMSMQSWIDSVMPAIPNDVDFFGKQEIMDENDQLIGTEPRLLLVSLEASLEETIDAIHSHGGRAVLAHVLDRVNSVTRQLGFIPPGLAYDALEIKSLEQKSRVLKSHPWITEDSTVWLVDSDAHRLGDMSEPVNFMQESVFRRLWGEA